MPLIWLLFVILVAVCDPFDWIGTYRSVDTKVQSSQIVPTTCYRTTCWGLSVTYGYELDNEAHTCPRTVAWSETQDVLMRLQNTTYAVGQSSSESFYIHNHVYDYCEYRDYRETYLIVIILIGGLPINVFVAFIAFGIGNTLSIKAKELELQQAIQGYDNNHMMV